MWDSLLETAVLAYAQTNLFQPTGLIAMNAKEYRKKLAEDEEGFNDLRDFDFIGSYKDETKKIKGFFNLFHGKKPNEKDSIKSIIEIAEDGQAIYEFLQNAVDANASEFFLFYNEEHFLVINNGKKFDNDGIESILNVSQSTKSDDESTIGKFGIGFKLVHRLVGENSGLEEIERYCGPILFSWDNNYLNDFLKNELTNIDDHWLFKILYTNFPCGVGETVKGVDYKEIMPFSQNELDGMISFIKTSLNSSSVDFKDLKEGSLFFLELGKGKSDLLENEEKSIKNGISYSIKIIQEVQENAKLNRVVINDTCVECDKNMEVISGESYIFMYPKSIEEALIFFKKPKEEKISFFKYFPMKSQNNNLNFMLHSEKFNIKTDREQLHEKTTINSKLLNKIANDLIKEFEKIKKQDEEHYRTILVNLYLSDLETAGGSTSIQTNLTSHLLAYIKKNIPIADSGVISSNTFVKIIDSKLDVKLKNYKKFFNFENADVIREAKSKLGLQEWNIIDALRNDDIEDWVKTLSSDDYLTFFNEINSAKNLNNESIKAISDKKIFSFSNGDFKSANEIDKSSKFFYKGSFGSQAEDILSNKFDFNFTIVNLLKYPELFHFLKKPKINSKCVAISLRVFGSASFACKSGKA